MNLLGIVLSAISLSMDAFSIALAYGLMNLNKKTILITSMNVGLFHFIMPILGLSIGNRFFEIIKINAKIIVAIIFIIIILEMIKSLFEKNDNLINLNIVGIILFSLLVSIDSFSLGIGLAYITNSYIIASSIFSLFSFLFTYTGFCLGKYLSIKMKVYSKLIGIIVMIILLVAFIINK